MSRKSSLEGGQASSARRATNGSSCNRLNLQTNTKKKDFPNETHFVILGPFLSVSLDQNGDEDLRCQAPPTQEQRA